MKDDYRNPAGMTEAERQLHYRNPAPDAAAPGPAPGTTHTMTISAADRFNVASVAAHTERQSVMKDGLREELARALAITNGDNFECIHRHKQHWQDHAGKDCAGRFRDVNALTQQDYLCLADAAIAAARPVIEREATAAIVAWLRTEDPMFADHGDEQNRGLADAIERGEHITEAKPPTA